MSAESEFVAPNGRPLAGPPTIGVEGEIGLLRELLQVERDRLAVARRIEEERSIVFPETTVIVKDVERLLDRIRAMEMEAAEAGETSAVEMPVSRKRRSGRF